MSAVHPKTPRGKQRHHWRCILGQSAAELPLYHSEWILDRHPPQGLGFLDLADRFAQGTALATLFVRAAPSQNLPDDLKLGMFFTLLDPGLICIRARHPLCVIPQFLDLAGIRDTRYRGHHAVYQARFIVGTNVRVDTEVYGCPLAWVYFRVALAILVLGQAWRMDQCRIYDDAPDETTDHDRPDSY